MPHSVVVERNEIFIGDHPYKLAGPLEKSLASQFPQKLVIGDYTEESNPFLSSITWDDFTGGLGFPALNLATDRNKYSFATQLETDIPDSVFILPAQFEVRVDSASANLTQLEFFRQADVFTYDTGAGVQRNKLFVATSSGTAGDPNVREWNPSATTDTTFPNTLRRALTTGSSPTDMKTGLLNDSYTLAVATDTGGVDYCTRPDTWSRNTTFMKYLAFGRSGLFGINSSGELHFTGDLGSSWINLTRFPGTSSDITGLFVGERADDEETAFIPHRSGVHIYDFEFERIVPTPIEEVYSPLGGDAFAYWRGSVYWGANQTVFKMTLRGGSVVETIGPDVKGFIPRDGYFWKFATSKDYLYAIYLSFTPGSQAAFVLRWNDRHWSIGHSLTTPQTALRGTFIHDQLSSDTTTTRHFALWNDTDGAAHVRHISHARTGPQTFAPELVSVTDYSSGTGPFLKTPTIQSDGEQEWTAMKLVAETFHNSSASQMTFRYLSAITDTAVFTDSHYTLLGTVEKSGVHELQFPRLAEDLGVPFRNLRISARASTTAATETPQLKHMTLVFTKALPIRWGFTANILMDADYKGRTPAEQRRDLESAMAAGLVEVTYRDEADGTERFKARVVSYQASEQTGTEESTRARATFVEVA